jgi:hypothetical protein
MTMVTSLELPRRLQHLEEAQQHPGGMALGGGDEDRAGEPVVGAGGGFEDGGGAEVDEGGGDGLAGGEAGEGFGGGAAQAAVDDADQGAVGGRDGVAGGEVDGAVGIDDLPVGATGDDGAGQPPASRAGLTLTRASKAKVRVGGLLVIMSAGGFLGAAFAGLAGGEAEHGGGGKKEREKLFHDRDPLLAVDAIGPDGIPGNQWRMR